MDPETFRAESRERWERAAEGWGSAREAMRRDAAPVTAWLLDAAAVGPGQTVLEVAAGPGDVGLEAARRVQPEGRVIVTDGAEAMVAVARRWADELGLPGVETRAMEAEWLDLPAASVDAVLSRWGLMLLADPEAALREARRVLRPGGRLAVAVWDGPQGNPWMARTNDLLAQRGLLQPAEPGAPGPFALADPQRLEELLWSAGLTGVRVEAVDFTFTAPSLDGWWDSTLATSQRMNQAVAGLAPAEHYALRDGFDATFAEFAAGNGGVSIPARSLVAVAEA